MNRGFEIDNIKFNTNSLAFSPEHTPILARIFTSFALIEGAIGGILGLLNYPDLANWLANANAFGTNAKRVAAVRRILTDQNPDFDRSTIEPLLLRVLKHAEDRNKIAHSIWGISQDAPDFIYRIPVKHWITFLASLPKHWNNAADITDDLKEYIESYDLLELNHIATEGEALVEALIEVYAKPFLH